MQLDLSEIKYALEKCLNAMTIEDFRNLLTDDGITPVLKELIADLDFNLIEPINKNNTSNKVNLKELIKAFDEE
jgi:hypothetical protein